MSDSEARLTAWRAVVTSHAAVTDRVQRALAAADLPPLSWFELLSAVKRSPTGRPRMSELALPERLDPVFEAVTAVDGPYGGVYLVGGTVRDLLLGEPSFDVDIAVEGDAIAFSSGCRVRRIDEPYRPS